MADWPNRWVVDADYPQGHLVPFTDVEKAQWDIDQAAGLAEMQALTTLSTNYSSLQTKVGQAIDALETAAANWDTLTATQKDSVLKLLVRLTARLARLVNSRLDASP